MLVFSQPKGHSISRDFPATRTAALLVSQTLIGEEQYPLAGPIFSCRGDDSEDLADCFVAFAAFVPADLVGQLRESAAEHEVFFACSWTDLDALLAQQLVWAAVIDPTISDGMKAVNAPRLLHEYPSVCFVAYVAANRSSLQAVAKLSINGLQDTIVHGPSNPKDRLRNTIERAQANRLVCDLLGPLERGLAELPPPILLAVRDLFLRPNRYTGAADVASEARVNVKKLYRCFERARLGTPKKMVTVAKVLRGYFLLRNSAASIRAVGMKIGYSRARVFGDQCGDILGCCPRNLRRASDSNEVVRQLLDWLYKPSTRAIGMIGIDSPDATTHRAIHGERNVEGEYCCDGSPRMD